MASLVADVAGVLDSVLVFFVVREVSGALLELVADAGLPFHS